MKTLLDPTDRAAILERVRRFRPDSPRKFGRMTPHGAICHLSDSFRVCLGDRDVTDKSSFMGRTVMRFVAATVPLRWPSGVQTMPEVDQEIDGTPPVEFAKDLADLEAITEDFVARLDPKTMKHPIFGLMRAQEWGRWGYRHLDHHARQFGL